MSISKLFATNIFNGISLEFIVVWRIQENTYFITRFISEANSYYIGINLALHTVYVHILLQQCERVCVCAFVTRCVCLWWLLSNSNRFTAITFLFVAVFNYFRLHDCTFLHCLKHLELDSLSATQRTFSVTPYALNPLLQSQLRYRIVTDRIRNRRELI